MEVAIEHTLHLRQEWQDAEDAGQVEVSHTEGEVLQRL